MRITKDQAASNKARVVAAAAQAFRAKGFEGVAVADLMRAAGLTHGGFYNHFASKAELEAEACLAAFAPAAARLEKIAACADASERRAAMAQYVERYLSAKARDAAAPACPMVAWSSDVARRGGVAQAAYAEGLKLYVEAFAKAAASGGGATPAKHTPAKRAAAIVKLSAMVGALSMARALASADADLADEILRAAAEELAR